ncbi:MAG: hypothetical protein ABF709_05515 [Leuconostoc pseudomesenteroides]|uniref:hypothetical protein n=1 Tax=Leuconostoc pseudomesenteroides TaxID=33968 RepID=UPI001E5BF1E8|nr:hypothetical protein [Leuconostoc pseudomesenteroides]
MSAFTLLFVYTLILITILIIGIVIHNSHMIIAGIVGVCVQVAMLIYLCYFIVPYM